MVLPFESKMMGALSELFIKCPYFIPVLSFSRISLMVISCDDSRGMNLWFLLVVMYVNGNEILSKSCMPIDVFFLLLPIPL